MAQDTELPDEGQPDPGVKVLDPEAALRVLVDLAVERPDFVYTTPAGLDAELGEAACVYSDADGLPSCLIGHLLARLGLPVPDVTCSMGAYRAGLGSWLYQAGVDVPDSHDPVWHVLDKAQSTQDDDCTWADAVELGLTAADMAIPARLRAVLDNKEAAGANHRP